MEIRNVAVQGLQEAMARQARAERGKRARVILGSTEAALGSGFVAAADTLRDELRNGGGSASGRDGLCVIPYRARLGAAIAFS